MVSQLPAMKLKQLSDNFVSEFLALERRSQELSACICLFGADACVMKVLAEEMKSTLAGAAREDVCVEIDALEPQGVAGTYYVDVSYFLGPFASKPR